MIVNTAITLAMAATCLATIATTPAANTQAPRRTVTLKRSLASNTSGCGGQITVFAKRGCEKSTARSPIRNSVKAASRVSIRAEPAED